MKNKRPENVYKERIEASESRLKSLKKIEIFLIFLKLFSIISGIFFLYRIALSFTLFSFFSFIFFLILLLAAAAIHGYFIKKREYQNALKRINENERKAVNGVFLDFDCGIEFIASEHEFSSDLDIFGEKSVFHYINRTTTSVGKKFLSNWLKTYPEENAAEVIRERQDAVKELTEKIELRQKSLVRGMFIEDSLKKLGSFYDFFDEPFSVLNKILLIAFIHMFPLITLAFIVLIFFKISWLIPLSLILIQGILNKITGKKISRIYNLISKYSKILNAYSKIIVEIEKENFESQKLKEIQGELYSRDKPASSYIKKLSTLLGYFEMRSSRSFHIIINNIFFWDLHCVYRIEKWKKNIGPEIPKWFDVIGNFEALSSFANTYYNNPGWTLPEVCGPEFKLDALSIGHPLIPKQERVCNNIKMEEKGNLVIVTGPNMSGKTIFIKTIGVNIVLALAGAPVCAMAFVISPVRLYTSMKVNDSLDKKLSLFYAELLRLKMILDAILNEESVFFVIDEMLKGTNALDRQKGSIALIKQLIKNNSDGIIATHDLELTKLEKEHPREILNYHFDGYIEGDKLVFDYKLKRGICESSNALELMKKIGIKV